MKPGNMELAFVIPVFNQLGYTRQCLDSLANDDVPDQNIVVVDNASTDGTAEFLAPRAGLRLITNPKNTGCAAAWNQGVEAALRASAQWVILLNNDVVVAPGFRDGLLDFARRGPYRILSPGMTEGELDYDFSAFAQDFLGKMAPALRRGVASGVCFMVARSVFEKIGLFDTQLGQAGYEDEDFFRRARRAGFQLAVTGRAYLHHFGSVTQKSLKVGLRISGRTPLGNREYFRKKHGLHWFRRRCDRLRERARLRFWRWSERRRFGTTLRLRRIGGQWRDG